MEVGLSRETEAKLSRVAAEQGRPTEALVEEAIERLLDHETWFLEDKQTRAQRGICWSPRNTLPNYVLTWLAQAIASSARADPSLRFGMTISVKTPCAN
jgi:hypothetical protein